MCRTYDVSWEIYLISNVPIIGVWSLFCSPLLLCVAERRFGKTGVELTMLYSVLADCSE